VRPPPARRPAGRIAVAAAGLALLLAGCGDDPKVESDAPQPAATTPKETVPTTKTTPTTPTQPPGPATEPQAPGEGDGNSGGGEDGGGDDGGTPAPEQEAPPGGSLKPPEDSPGNDRPPASGSPADRFERYCEQHPEECG
jgi:hypothetical protein